MKSREINSLFKNLSKVIKNPRSDLKYKNIPKKDIRFIKNKNKIYLYY